MRKVTVTSATELIKLVVEYGTIVVTFTPPNKKLSLSYIINGIDKLISTKCIFKSPRLDITDKPNYYKVKFNSKDIVEYTVYIPDEGKKIVVIPYCAVGKFEPALVFDSYTQRLMSNSSVTAVNIMTPFIVETDLDY